VGNNILSNISILTVNAATLKSDPGMCRKRSYVYTLMEENFSRKMNISYPFGAPLRGLPLKINVHEASVSISTYPLKVTTWGTMGCSDIILLLFKMNYEIVQK
jgi:hypothetical protein